jgi:ABC-type Fe3+-hydroxamate transport system substrate-binding protein
MTRIALLLVTVVVLAGCGDKTLKSSELKDTIASQFKAQNIPLHGRVSCGLDHVVDVAALGGDVGVGEALLVVLAISSARARSSGRRRLGELLAVDDVDRALGPITAISAVGQAKVEVGAEVLGVHDVVGAAVGLAGDHGELRHGRLGSRRRAAWRRGG